MDRLSELLASVRARSASWIHLEATAPWAVSLRSRPSAFCVHHVLAGNARLTTAQDGASIPLGPGAVVAIPHGRAHAIGDRSDTPPTALETLPATRIGPSEDDRVWHVRAMKQDTRDARTPTRIVSALIELEDPFSASVVSSLPSVLQLASPRGEASPLVVHLRLLAAGLASMPHGASLVLARMADVVFIHALRAHVETLDDEGARSCVDPSIAYAPSAIPASPRPWRS